MADLKWTDIWNKPFKYDHYGYVWGADGVMTFNVDDLTEENDKWMQEFCDNLVKALNDEECQKYENLHIEDGCDLYQGETLIGCFRGWGHLTGGLKMKPEMAAQYQDEMIKAVLEKIGK
jgi:hypothetical protein